MSGDTGGLGSSGAAASTLNRPVASALVRLALPVLASQTLRLAFQWVDALWVRGLGVNATAAITTSVFVMWTVYSLHDIFGIGISAYVSQLMGAGDRPRAGVAAWKGIQASALLGLVGVALGVFGAKAIFRAMDPSGRIVEEGASYLGVVLLGAPFIMVSLSCENVLRACGDTRTPFVVDFVAIALNAALAPVPKATLAQLVDQIDYAVKKIGVDHVGIASDFNHGGGVTGWKDESEAFNVTAELLRRGYSEADIAKLWGGNFLRVWSKAQEVGKQLNRKQLSSK